MRYGAKADITCLDYSADMMGQAQEKADRLHLKNVTFRQGDVGALPYVDGVLHAALRDDLPLEKTAGETVRNRNIWNSEEHGMVCLPESRIRRTGRNL